MKFYSIAIDGPSGAGKSTLAKYLANALNFVYLDTGAIYRAIGCYLFDADINPSDAESVEAVLPNINLEIKHQSDGVQHMIVNGKDETSRIRYPEISRYASDCSAIPAVRSFLLDTQRNFAKNNNVIMDGRDIGTVVLPNADMKIFMNTDLEIRAQRRVNELIERGTPQSYEQVINEMRTRDYNDSHRAIAPLKPAKDAVFFDTSNENIELNKKKIVNLVKEYLKI